MSTFALLVFPPARPARRAAAAAAAATLLFLLAGMTPALADRDDEERSYRYDDGGCRYRYKEDEDGYKIEYRCRDASFGAPRYKYESEYAGCEYEYEQDARGYKEELECDDDRPWWAAGRGLIPRHGGLPPIVFGGPFGIGVGRCDSELIGRAAGGAVGGAIGSRIGSGSGRELATIAGAVIGVIIGGETGRSLDQSCAGQALEHGRAGRPVEWRDAGTGAHIRLTPMANFTGPDGRYCREFRSLIDGLAGREARETVERACRRADGAWERLG